MESLNLQNRIVHIARLRTERFNLHPQTYVPNGGRQWNPPLLLDASGISL